MRKLLGSVVLAAGVGGLGWYGAANNAERMQAEVTAGAAAVASQAVHGVAVSVAGRDITASGLVASETELNALRTSLNDVDGRRVVNLDGVSVLPTADPFEISASQEGGAWGALSGAIPAEGFRAELAAVTGTDTASLTLSTGAPDTNWGAAALAGIAGASDLQSADMTLSGTVLSITGTALTPSDKAEIEQTLASGLPQGYTLEAAIETLDDGTPLRLRAEWDGVTGSATGKAPAGFDLGAVPDVFPGAFDTDIAQSVLPSEDANWAAAATAGLTALGTLNSGTLEMSGADVTLTGVALPDAKAEAEALISGLPDGYNGSADISIYDDGAPFSLMVGYDGETASVAGKLPADVALADLDAGFENAVLDGTIDQALITDPTETWEGIAQTGLAALGQLEEGALSVMGTQIVLTGTAKTPAADTEIATTLAALPDGATSQVSLRYLDDGSPAHWMLTYDAAQGGVLSGKLPSGLTSADIATHLSLGSISGNPTQGLAEADTSAALEALELANEYLPETEALTLDLRGGAPKLDVVLSPGVDAELVALDLSERLPGGVEFSIGTVANLPEDGAERFNRATGLQERFQSGSWLPVLAFEADAQTCASEAGAVLSEGGVNFLSGAARLDAKSNRAINLVSSIVLKCVTETELNVEVEGHTDSSGDDASNQALSEARANAVRDALIRRGVPDTVVFAIGYGETQPIADNETEEGKAANRRTELRWFVPEPEPAPAAEEVSAETSAEETGE